MADTAPSLPRHSSVKTLLNGLFDYAGLFPPASLDMEAALKLYLEHRAHPDAWMLGPFVVPSARLEEVLALEHLFSAESPVAFDVLPRRAGSMDVMAETLPEDLARCTRFIARMEGKASIQSMEFAFPEDALLTGEKTVESISRIQTCYRYADFEHINVFGEIQREHHFAEKVPMIFLGLASQSGAGVRIAGKIRCGGMSSEDFPSTDELAAFLLAAVQIGHPFKATAGLHHPVRHFNEEQQVTMHGFMNVFFATTLALEHNLDQEGIREILEDEDPSSFAFTPSGIQWVDLSASTTTFLKARSALSLSIGSCSFSEPREDLHELGWLS